MVDSILLVDDEVSVTRSLRRLLKHDNLEIYTANNAKDALELLQTNTIKVVISDQLMPEVTGTELLAEIRQCHPHTVRMILSGYADFQALSEAINNGEIYKFLVKPWNTELLRAEVQSALHLHKLQQLNAQLGDLFKSTIEAIVLCDHNGHIKSVNPAYTKLTGFSADHVVDQHVAHLFSLADGDPLTTDIVDNNPAQEWHGECFCKKQNGADLPAWLNFMAIHQGDKQSCYALLFIDISQQKLKEARIEHQAYHDELTGLPNRRLLINHLELALHQRSRNEADNTLALLFIDLDRFKCINDSLGHDIGDALLKDVAGRLASVLRKGDTLARFGGDEFVVLLSRVKNSNDCKAVCEKIIAALKPAFHCNNHEIYISPSIGISVAHGQLLQADSLLRHADAAMYRAKQRGGNTFAVFDQRNDTQLRERIVIETGLRKGLERNEFVVFYQPQAALDSGDIRACEALVRWQHPAKGLVSPAGFIEIAEQVGLIHGIGQQVIDKACHSLAHWQHQHHVNCRLSVNLSARQFADANILASLQDLIDKSQIIPEWLELEVTETALLQDMDSGIATLNAMRDLGVRIALDDFGTGYSSLSYLQRLPIHTLKIDQSFVRPLPADKQTGVIVSSIIHMAKSLGLSVVAEGVETKAQWQFLRNCGCDLAQGYLVSPPVDEAQFFTHLCRDEKREFAELTPAVSHPSVLRNRC